MFIGWTFFPFVVGVVVLLNIPSNDAMFNVAKSALTNSPRKVVDAAKAALTRTLSMGKKPNAATADVPKAKTATKGKKCI